MVSRQAIWMKKRYAEDPDYRDQQIARSLRHYWEHKDEINEGQRERYQADPEYRRIAPAARRFVARGIRVAPRGGRAGRLCG